MSKENEMDCSDYESSLPLEYYIEYLRRRNSISIQKFLKCMFRTIMWEFLEMFPDNTEKMFQDCGPELYKKFDSIMGYLYMYDVEFENYPTVTEDVFIEKGLRFMKIPNHREIAETNWNLLVETVEHSDED